MDQLHDCTVPPINIIRESLLDGGADGRTCSSGRHRGSLSLRGTRRRKLVTTISTPSAPQAKSPAGLRPRRHGHPAGLHSGSSSQLWLTTINQQPLSTDKTTTTATMTTSRISSLYMMRLSCLVTFCATGILQRQCSRVPHADEVRHPLCHPLFEMLHFLPRTVSPERIPRRATETMKKHSPTDCPQ